MSEHDIRRVGVKLFTTVEGYIRTRGIRLFDAKNNMIVGTKWDKFYGEWKYYNIPKGEKLVGFHGIYSNAQRLIIHLGCITSRQHKYQ